ncbi:Protein SINE3 [Camellia lanceoleosa]|uniref:Protein SINE3 n=1 Tax=Camellia lanceoleosa TaxID=1840588 RepID=A0ACC0GPG9_9ERIC|nr:Protein SINE3 [Camellia lanceoleosa]
MKDYQLQTPRKDHHHHHQQHANRRSKSISDHTKKSQKISKKCLDSVFTSVSEDVSFKSPKGSIEFSSLSEISEDHQFDESAESFISSLNPVLSPSSETVALSDLTPLSSAIADVSVCHYRSAETKNSIDIVAVEAEMVCKKLLDTLIEVVIGEFNALPEEKDRFAELVLTKTQVVFLSFLLWILAVSVVFLFSSGVQSSFSEPPPT